MGRNKYHAQKVVYGGQTFDSKAELRRWQELVLLEHAGKISGLQRQVPFELIPPQREPDTTGPRGGIRRGAVLENAVVYVADFVYQQDGRTVVEDVKGHKTRDYILKRKLMLYVHGIRIKETR